MWIRLKTAHRSQEFVVQSNCNCNWGTCIAPATRRPRAHHRVSPYLGARRQNETEMFSDHDETSLSIAAVSALSVACSMLAFQQQKRLCRQFGDMSTTWRGCHTMKRVEVAEFLNKWRRLVVPLNLSILHSCRRYSRLSLDLICFKKVGPQILDTHDQVCLITKHEARFARFTFNDRRGLRRNKKETKWSKQIWHSTAYARVTATISLNSRWQANAPLLRVGVKQN